MMSGDVIVLDVRALSEYEDGHIENAILLPHDEIGEKAESVFTDKTQTILVYCKSGMRAAKAADLLSGMGYANVFSFGGILNWPYQTIRG